MRDIKAPLRNDSKGVLNIKKCITLQYLGVFWGALGVLPMVALSGYPSGATAIPSLRYVWPRKASVEVSGVEGKNEWSLQNV